MSDLSEAIGGVVADKAKFAAQIAKIDEIINGLIGDDTTDQNGVAINNVRQALAILAAGTILGVHVPNATLPTHPMAFGQLGGFLSGENLLDNSNFKVDEEVLGNHTTSVDYAPLCNRWFAWYSGTTISVVDDVITLDGKTYQVMKVTGQVKEGDVVPVSLSDPSVDIKCRIGQGVWQTFAAGVGRKTVYLTVGSDADFAFEIEAVTGDQNQEFSFKELKIDFILPTQYTVPNHGIELAKCREHLQIRGQGLPELLEVTTFSSGTEIRSRVIDFVPKMFGVPEVAVSYSSAQIMQISGGVQLVTGITVEADNINSDGFSLHVTGGGFPTDIDVNLAIRLADPKIIARSGY